MAEDHKPYDLEPDEPVQPEESSSTASAEERGGEPVPHLDEPGLLDDFPVDADFDDDPEMNRVITGQTEASEVEAEPAATEPDTREEFVKTGWDNPVLLLILGGIGLLSALIATGVTAPEGSGAGAIAKLVILTLYFTALHTGTGLVAVMLGAFFTESRFSRAELAAARIFLCVAIFEFISHLNVPIPGRFDELLLGALAYMLVLWGTFRLGRTSLAILAGSHFILWLIVYIGNMLYSQAQRASAAS